MTEPGTTDLVAVHEDTLRQAGFTSSGEERFKAAMTDFAEQLCARSIQYGDADRAEGLGREITHDHVRSATLRVVGSFARRPRSGWHVTANIGEYICTAIAGLSAGHIQNGWCIVIFVLSVALGVLLIGYRLFRRDGE